MSPTVAIRSDRASTLADFTSPGLLVQQLSRRDVAGVIDELSQALAREARVPDQSAFQEAVRKREAQANSQMESGMAFPHARLPGLDRISFALGRSAEPLAWRAGEAPDVRLVFLLAVPVDAAAQYLHLIAGLSRLSRDTRLMEQLRSARDAAQMFETLRQVQLVPDSRSANTRNGF